MAVFDKSGRPLTGYTDVWTRNASGAAVHPAHLYGKNKQELSFSSSLSGIRWVAFGDSLTDDTGACRDGAPNKYHKLIADGTGAAVVVKGLGGTGYWKTQDAGTCFSQRMAASAADSAVDIVTIFGSVNDHTVYWGGGYGSDNYYLKAGAAESGGYVSFDVLGNTTAPSDAEIASGIAQLSLDDRNPQSGTKTFVGYVNDCIDAAHEKYPNAKVVLVHEIAFYNTKAGQLKKERAIREAIVTKRRASGDGWLYLFKLNECRFEGLDDSERKYLNTVANAGLSFDSGQLEDSVFRGYYTYDGAGHPNDRYNRLWLGPVFAALLCDVFGISRAGLPSSLSVGSYDTGGLWIGVGGEED
ncbi:MAG: GDSL-type esterase/lipase family protein [Clostridia bacterium]|nr:GDSL-type esterase/lipase family protein [Clostridia bacterium]